MTKSGGAMLRLIPIAAVLVGLALAVPTSANVTAVQILYAESGIRTVRADGSSPTLLRPHGCSQAGCISPQTPRWSPDGSRILFVQSPARARTDVRVIDADGSNERLLVVTPTPPDPAFAISRQTWSPDGESFTFGPTPQVDWGDIYTRPIEGGLGSSVRRTFDTFPKQPAVWSPDGTRLLYSRHVQSVRFRSELFVLPLAGGGETQITSSGPGAALNENPVWSPDGSLVAFNRSVGGDPSRIYVVRPDGTGLRRVSTVPGERPSWSPDGGTLAFSSPSGSGRDIYVISLDGTGERRVTKTGALGTQNDDVTWSPQGGRLLFTSATVGQSALYTINPDGSCDRRIATGQDGMWSPLSGPPTGTDTERCHRLGTTATSVANRSRTRATVTVKLLNEGTEPLSRVGLAARPMNQFSFIDVAPTQGSCTITTALACDLGVIGTSHESRVVFRVESRRITRNRALVLPIRIKRDGLPVASIVDVTLGLSRCHTASAGRGLVLGTSEDDQLCGRSGRDVIVGGAGDDRLRGGAGDDRLKGGAGRDVILGGRGRDTIESRDRLRDRIVCGRGRDRVVADRRDSVARDCERVARRR
jgi:TolB protein